MKQNRCRTLIVLAVCVSLLITCFAGCSQKPHEHTWDAGKVTTAASCEADGVMTYTCTECGETKTEPIPAAHTYGEAWDGDDEAHWHACSVCGDVTDKAAHTWDAGEVTKEPTPEADGEQTFTCTVCGRTKTEAVVLPEETEIANFTRDFSGSSQGTWKYGYAKDFNFDTNTFTFVALPTFNGEAWTDGDGIEIKADWLRNETGGAPAVVQYVSEVSGSVRITVSFAGSDAVTRMTARLHIAKPDGSIKVCEFIGAGIESKDWQYDYTAELEQGDVVSLIFFTEGSAGYFHGNFSMAVMTGNHTHEPVEMERKDPTCVEPGWTAGTVCAVCGEVFQGHEEIPAVGHAYSKSWRCDGTNHWHACTVCGSKTDVAGHTWDGGKVTKEPTKEDDGVRTFTCTVCGGTRTESIPNLSHTEIANFAQDFAVTQTGNWRYGYTTDFDFGKNTFTFRELPTFNGEAWTDGDGIEIKSDWLRNETGGAPAVVRYISEVSGKLQFHVAFQGSDAVTRMTARLHIAKADGTVKACEFIGAGTQAKDWTYDYTAEVEKGDAVSLIFFTEGSAGYFHGKFAMTILADKHIHTPLTVEGKAPTCTEPGWTAGTVCAVCGEVLEGHESIPATGHHYGDTWAHDAESHYHACTVCGDKKDVAGHEWDDGLVTTEPTMDAEGVKTYTCQVCGETKTEAIPKLTEAEIANYTDDFSGTQDGCWKYGYTNDFNFNNDTFTFRELPTFNGDAWTDGAGIELKSDWIRNETGGTQAVVRYVAERSGNLRVKITFTGSDPATRIAARLHIAKADGSVKCEFIGAGTQAKDWAYDTTVEVEAGDAISLLFFSEGNGGFFHGKFSMVVIAEDHVHELVWKSDGTNHWQACTVCGYQTDPTTEHPWGEAQCVDDAQHKYTCMAEGCNAEKLEAHILDTVVTKAPTLTESGILTDTCRACTYSAQREAPARKFADYQADFSGTVQGTQPGQWKYGYATEYDFGTDNFLFHALTSTGEGWSGIQGIEIKRDWLLAENDNGANVAVGYLVPAGKSQLEVQVSFTHADADEKAEARLAARVLVVGADGNTRTAEFLSEGQTAASWSATRKINVTEGDTVYVILFPEPNTGWRQGGLQVILGDA